ncbi:MAG TPA: ribosome biogenesis GTPase Der, partial [Candidatus Nitrosotenuis sp.]|nr:ribosome biogenesis GTPase Der [Candidatus Nitrosotenuis sp.]
ALFNRLIGRRTAIVEDRPGITRDRLYSPCEWNGVPFTVVDTGGMDPFDPDELRRQVHRQAARAVEEAAVLVLVVDLQEGLHPLDEEVAGILRRHRKPVIVAVNKAESERRQDEIYEFYRLGLGEPLPVSALHGLGTGDLLDRVVELLPPAGEEEIAEEVAVVLLGRPNVGKSSLLNRILGEERSIVHPAAGTTRDAVDTFLLHGGRRIRLVDTAGLRRRARVDESVEYYSSLRAVAALRRSHVALLVLDAGDGVVAQDKRVAGQIRQAGAASVILVNKWDLVKGTAAEKARWQEEFARTLASQLDFLAYSPVLYVSALSGEGTGEILEAALEVAGEHARQLDPALLNQVVQEAVALRPPPSFKGRTLSIRSVAQRGTRPPRLVFRVNDAGLVHFSYRRYLENQIRAAFGLVGTPLEMRFVGAARRKKG